MSETNQTTAAGPGTGTSYIKSYNEKLCAALAEYRERNELTLAELARELNVGITQLSKYLNRHPEGDVVKLEQIAHDVLRNEERRRNVAVELWGNDVAKAVEATCNVIRETNDVGMIFGPAGLGKTCGAQLYVAQNPSAILITAAVWACNARAVESALFRAITNRGYPGNITRGAWLAEKLARSNRLIMVDNAHRLTRAAIAWLFDFHDETECPIVFLGNPELLGVLKQNDQWFSRIGLKREIRLGQRAAVGMVKKLAAKFLPESGEALLPLCQTVAENQGHFRAVKKQLLLARKQRELEPSLDWETAFKHAHKQLVRDYALN